MNPDKFKPGHKFLSHIDPKHKKSLEKKEFDFEYQREFRAFILNALRESNMDISNELLDIFDVPKSARTIATKPCSVYIESTEHFAKQFNNKVPIYKHAFGRFFLDKGLWNRFDSLLDEKKDENLTPGEIDKLATETFLRKINLNKLITLMHAQTDQAKKNILMLIIQIINPDAIIKTDNEIKLNVAKRPFNINIPGTCLDAEDYMFSYLSGKYDEPGGGYTNLILDKEDHPVMLEKVGIGNSHSCISLKPVRLDKVLIPAGAIFGAVPDDVKDKKNRQKKIPGAINYIKSLKDYKGFLFLRMSLFSLPEEIRSSAGGSYYSRLIRRNENFGYVNYDWITPEIIAEYAEDRLEEFGFKK